MRRSLFTAASSSRRPTNPRIEADERIARPSGNKHHGPSSVANRQHIVSFRATAHRFVFGVSGRQRIAAFSVAPYRFSRSSRDPSANPPSIRRNYSPATPNHPTDGELIRGDAATIASPQLPAVDVTPYSRSPGTPSAKNQVSLCADNARGKCLIRCNRSAQRPAHQHPRDDRRTSNQEGHTRIAIAEASRNSFSVAPLAA
jgi:hypothetical protein